MIKQLLKKITLTVVVLASFLAPVALVGSTALAQGAGNPPANTDTTIKDGLCRGSDLSLANGGNCTINEQQATQGLDNLIRDIVNIVSIIVAIVAVIMIIIGGFKYITSGGDSGKVSSAKNTIIYAVVGLIVVALAQFIVKFVLSKATGLTTTPNP